MKKTQVPCLTSQTSFHHISLEQELLDLPNIASTLFNVKEKQTDVATLKDTLMLNTGYGPLDNQKKGGQCKQCKMHGMLCVEKQNSYLNCVSPYIIHWILWD